MEKLLRSGLVDHKEVIRLIDNLEHMVFGAARQLHDKAIGSIAIDINLLKNRLKDELDD